MTSYTTDLFLFIIGHFFLSSMWSSNIRNFVQKWGLEFFNCKTLKTVNHWFGLLSWICFTISHSLSSCLCFIFWHFSEHILSPHLALQSDKSIPVWEQLAQKFGVKLWGGPVIKGHSSKMISSLCTRTNQLEDWYWQQKTFLSYTAGKDDSVSETCLNVSKAQMNPHGRLFS